ncbi:MAG: hypothetical protein J3K34DRAFT_460113 [Monoraphidium minutum]|nr:MAG: hypothetical protein J3K34DRAFT_460113 [Monoraphidium minutum]
MANAAAAVTTSALLEAPGRGALIVHPLFQHTVGAVPEPRSFWEAAPDELLHHIAGRLGDGAALARLRRVSKRCRRVVDAGEDLWRDLCVARFNASPHTAPPSSWRELYSFNHTLLYELFKKQLAEAMLARLRRAAGAPIRLRGIGGIAFA